MILRPVRFGLLLVFGVCKDIIIYKFFNVCHFNNTTFVVIGKVGIP